MKIVFGEYRRSSLSFLLMALMVTTSFVVLASGHASAEAVDETGTALDAALPGADPMTKIDPDLLLKMKGSEGPFTVNLVVTDRTAVNKVLSGNGLNELKGFEFQGMPTMRMMDLTSDQITALASSSGTSKIAPYVAPEVEKTSSDDMVIEKSDLQAAPPEVDDWDVDYLHGATDAWDMGFYGDGVKIAVIDTGMDMAHPDLYGQQARYSSGAYSGWPIAFEASAASAWANYDIGGWVADTSYMAVEDAGYVEFDGNWYYVSGIPTASGYYHIGYHTDANLAYLMGYYVGVLVTDSTTPGVYDTVYVDVWGDFDFTNDKPCTMGDEISYIDVYNTWTEAYDFSSWNTGDGYPDLSGGMVYWVSDGMNVYPGSDWIYGADWTPESGAAVAFVGEFSLGQSHGTMTSSAALGNGNSMWGMLTGMAPSAELIAIPFNGDSWASWLFAELGADPYTSGDEANICSNSYGWSGNAIWAGYDELTDMYAAYISGFYGGNTLWLWATGNGGPGYGTLTSVWDPSSVHVGAGTTMQYRAELGMEQDINYAKWGDVIPFSNSGPSRTGKLNSEVIASGAYSLEPMPLNNWDYFGSILDGFMHFQIGSGTSHATPTVAGGAALGYEAYYWWTGGGYPDYNYAKAKLMAACDDMHFDPLKQGAGWLNAGNYVRGLLYGAVPYVDTIAWSGWNEPAWTKAALYPGYEYGNRLEAMPNFLAPGESDSSHIFETINYDSANPVNVEITSEILLRTDSDVITMTTADEGSIYVDLTGYVPATTDLLKVTMFMPFDQFDPEMDYVSNVQYWLELHDWVDLDMDGVMNTSSGNWELFRYTVDGSDSNYNQVMIKDPIVRTNDGLIARVRSIAGAAGIDITLQLDYYELTTFPWITLMEYGGSSWSTSLSTAISPWGYFDWYVNVEVPIDAPIGTYAAAIYVNDGTRVQNIPVVINVPATDYEFDFGGASYFDTPYNNEFQGLADKGWRFEVGDWRMYWCMPSDYIDPTTYLMVNVSWTELPTDVNIHVLASEYAGWPIYGSYPYGIGYSMTTIASSDEQYMGGGTFGIYTNTGGPSEVLTAPLGQYIWDTGPAPFMILTRCPVMAGSSASDTLYGHTMLMSINDYSPYSVYLDAYQPGPIPLEGTVPGWYDITTSIPVEVKGSGDGPYESEANYYLDIYQDSMTGDFVYDLANAWFTWYLWVEDCPEFIVTTMEEWGAPDIDLGVWFDEDMDYEADLTEPYMYVGASGSYEVLTWEAPADGQYIIKVLGYSVTGDPGYFDLFIDTAVEGYVTVTNYETTAMSGTYTFDIAYNVPARVGTFWGTAMIGFAGADDTIEIPFTIVVTDVGPPTIDSLSPYDGESLATSSPTISFYANDHTYFYTGIEWWSLYVTIDWYFDVSDLAYWIDDANVTIELPMALAEGEHLLYIEVADWYGNWGGSYTTFTVNSVIETFTAEFLDPATADPIPDSSKVALTEVLVSGWTDPYADVLIENAVGSLGAVADEYGYFESDPMAMGEGLNIFTITTTNDAGVEASMVKMLESDTHCMLLLNDVASPTSDATAYIRGWTDADATVTVDGDGVSVMPDGTFEGEVALAEGDNVFVVEATDSVGNTATADVTIVLDTTAPMITIDAPDDEAVVTEAAVTVSGTVDDAAAMVWVNGVSAEDGAGGFSAVVTLTEGDNTITVVAEDELGNSASEIISVTYEPPVYVTPDEMQDMIDELQVQIDDLQDQVDDLVTEDGTIQGLIDDLQTALDELQADLDGQIGDVNESLLQEIADLQDQIDTLQEQIDQDVGDVNTRVDDANAFADLLMYLSIGLFAIAIVMLAIVWFMLSGRKGGSGPEHSTEEISEPGAPSDVEKEFEELEREISKDEKRR